MDFITPVSKGATSAYKVLSPTKNLHKGDVDLQESRPVFNECKDVLPKSTAIALASRYYTLSQESVKLRTKQKGGPISKAATIVKAYSFRNKARDHHEDVIIISNKYLSSKAEEEMLARPDEIGREEDIQDDLAMLSSSNKSEMAEVAAIGIASLAKGIASVALGS